MRLEIIAQLSQRNKDCVEHLLYRGVPCLGVSEYFADVAHRALDAEPRGGAPTSGPTLRGLPRLFGRLGANEWPRLRPDGVVWLDRRGEIGADLPVGHDDLHRCGSDSFWGRVGPGRRGNSILNVLRG